MTCCRPALAAGARRRPVARAHPVRLFKVPDMEPGPQIPFSRVNHNKYMVTDQVAYIGTSNWSGDYFVNTGGIGLVVNSSRPGDDDSVRAQLAAVFERDWESEHSAPLQAAARR
ncbi:5'-3' exonuclease PLD3-like [Amphibalanus amphitrite]|uniref:5'-3' exonuclease PLD3-like n=1 Tax=Amphibalanus amphitrite TaxID=1232801 RepID=UPI001C906E01|nr:5'-3' exonuclease PLD3-like [Amphibalanus amphitrite]